MDFVKEIKDIYEESFAQFIQRISSDQQQKSRRNDVNLSLNQEQSLEQQQPQYNPMDRIHEIQNAFLHLDNDLSVEALEHTNIRTMAVAMSGTH